MPYLVAGYLSIWLIWMPLRFMLKARGNKNASTVFKVIPTLIAATVAGVACMSRPGMDATGWLLFLGVVIGACADVALEYRFKLGGTLFFAAHCLFVAALLLMSPPTGWLLVVGIWTFSLAMRFLSHYQPYFADKTLRLGVTLYAVALSALLGAAVPAPLLSGGPRALTGALGALLFVISDATLCRNSVAHRMARAREAQAGGVLPGEERKRVLEEYLSLGCYYTAQMAFSICAGLIA